MKLQGIMTMMTLVALGSAAQAETIPTKYSITGQQAFDLGTLGGYHSGATDINDVGDIVGWANDGTRTRAFIRLAGQNQLLPLDDGTDPYVTGLATGINNSRVVVGYYHSPEVFDQGFYYYPGIWMSDIANDAFGLGFPWRTHPLAINNLDYIVGRGKVLDEPGGNDPPDTTGVCYTDWVPMFWDGAGQNPFGLNCYPDPDANGVGYLGVEPGAKDINDSNWIVGADGGHSAFAMFLRKGQFANNTPVPKPSGSPSGFFGSANGINNAGKVVGAYGYSATGEGGHNRRAFFWDPNAPSPILIGMLPGGTYSEANEINDQDMIVGKSDRSLLNGGAGFSAFIFHPDFGMVRLKDPGEPMFPVNLSDCEALAVNNRKSGGLVEVVGNCLFGPDQNYRHAVLWQLTVAKKPRFPL